MLFGNVLFGSRFFVDHLRQDFPDYIHMKVFAVSGMGVFSAATGEEVNAVDITGPEAGILRCFPDSYEVTLVTDEIILAPRKEKDCLIFTAQE